MKRFTLISLMALLLPVLASAQSQNTSLDDIYIKPSDAGKIQQKTAEQKKNGQTQAPKYKNGAREIVYIDRTTASQKDSSVVLAQMNDSVAQQNQDSTGYYLNGFKGNQSDLEYANRLRRFHDPKYTIFIGDPRYNDVYFLNSSDWNVYLDGSYAYVTPTWTNPYWYDYQYRPYSSWGYSGFYGYPYSYGAYYGGFYGGYYGNWNSYYGFSGYGYGYQWPFYDYYGWNSPYYGYGGYYGYGCGYYGGGTWGGVSTKNRLREASSTNNVGRYATSQSVTSGSGSVGVGRYSTQSNTSSGRNSYTAVSGTRATSSGNSSYVSRSVNTNFRNNYNSNSVSGQRPTGLSTTVGGRINTEGASRSFNSTVAGGAYNPGNINTRPRTSTTVSVPSGSGSTSVGTRSSSQTTFTSGARPTVNASSSQTYNEGRNTGRTYTPSSNSSGYTPSSSSYSSPSYSSGSSNSSYSSGSSSSGSSGGSSRASGGGGGGGGRR